MKTDLKLQQGVMAERQTANHSAWGMQGVRNGVAMMTLVH